MKQNVKKVLPLLIGALVVVSAGMLTSCEKNYGKITDKKLAIADYTAIEVTNGVDIEMTSDITEPVLTADELILDKVEVKVENGTLSGASSIDVTICSRIAVQASGKSLINYGVSSLIAQERTHANCQEVLLSHKDNSTSIYDYRATIRLPDIFIIVYPLLFQFFLSNKSETQEKLVNIRFFPYLRMQYWLMAQ